MVDVKKRKWKNRTKQILQRFDEVVKKKVFKISKPLKMQSTLFARQRKEDHNNIAFLRKQERGKNRQRKCKTDRFANLLQEFELNELIITRS